MRSHKAYLLVNEQKEDDFYIFEEALSAFNRMYIFVTQTKPESNTFIKLKFMEGDIDGAETFLTVKDDLVEAIQRKGYKLVSASEDFKTYTVNHPWIPEVLNQTNEYIKLKVVENLSVEDFERPQLRKLKI